MEIGKTLRKLRISSGLTQQDIADKLDVTRAAVGQWESDKTMPRKGSLELLSDLFGVKVSELMGDDYPAGSVPFKPSGSMVPLLGHAHMGAFGDEDAMDEMVEIPSAIASRHPRAFLVHAQGGCMDRLYPSDALLLVDPDMEPVSGCPVLAESSDYGAVVRLFMRGSTHTFLAASSATGDYPDIVAGPDDAPVTIKGRVVWYMGEGDER